MKKSNFNLNTLKGRIAEQLVQDIFIHSGYNVFIYGLERIHPSLSKLISFNNQKTSKVLRFMPDFVVQSSKNGNLFYMEVKYRSNGEFRFDDNYKDYPYQNAWFVIVSPEKIQCLHYKSLIKDYYITPESNFKLSRVKSFHIDPDFLEEYENYAADLFKAYIK